MATVSAAQRLIATERQSIELPKFRYIDDITRYLESMRGDVNESEALVRVQQQQLAHLRRPREWVSAALTKFSTTDRKKIDPELKRVVIPNVKKLESQYGLSEDLYEKYRLLEAVESQLAAQFPDRKGEAYDKAIGTLRELKKKVAEQMRNCLGFLSEVAKEHVPKTFSKYVQAVTQEIEEHVQFENSEQFLYVSTDEGTLVFTNYIMLINAVNEDAQKVPHLYISIQWVVGVAVYVTINHEFELPSQLICEPGTEAKSLIEAVSTIAALLNGEGFASSLGENQAPRI
jgi:hypothetical protein